MTNKTETEAAPESAGTKEKQGSTCNLLEAICGILDPSPEPEPTPEEPSSNKNGLVKQRVEVANQLVTYDPKVPESEEPEAESNPNRESSMKTGGGDGNYYDKDTPSAIMSPTMTEDEDDEEEETEPPVKPTKQRRSWFWRRRKSAKTVEQ